MTELVESTERSPDSPGYVASLLQHYGFDLGGDAIEGLLLAWQEQYPAAWTRLAIIEALYQGRYKAISVVQILALWQRRSQPVYHFNREFERLICDRLPQPLTPPAVPPEEPSLTRSAQAMVAKLPLPGIESAQTTLALQSAEAMQALRTLYGDVTAALTDRITLSKEPLSKEPSQTRSHADSIRSDLERSTTERSDMERSDPIRSDLMRSDMERSTTERSYESLIPASVDERLVEAKAAPTPSKIGSTLQPPMSPSALLPSDSTTSLTASNEQAQPITTQTATTQTASIARILQQLNDQELCAKPMFCGIELLAQTGKPKSGLQLTARHQPLWLTQPSNQPIHQFTPASEPSDFHNRLKTVAQLPDSLLDDRPDQPEQDDDRPPHS